ncbi:S1/P1 nuclease [Rhizobium leguminosarum]|uniref:S1/P1 nuclease n=1 Tax=Rhizobium leguminosarum TaxID=384 RepID=UPI0036DE0DA1
MTSFPVLMAAASLSMLACGDALAWGESGHSIVAELAQRRLSEQTRIAVADLLGEGTSLASISSWADDFRATKPGKKTTRWHFIDIDVGKPDAGHACELDPVEGDCIVAALKREIAVLADRGAGRTARTDALKFVVHLVGDIHQPLHCSERDGDRGGNSLEVTLQGIGPDNKPRTADVNFHKLWDETLIGAHAFSWGAYGSELETSVMPGMAAGMLQGEYIAGWANECFQQAVQVYDKVPTGPASNGRILIDETYQAFAQPILDRELVLGGLRLAAVLNDTLGKRPGEAEGK